MGLFIKPHIYLWRKVVCLFCSACTYEIHQTRMLEITFLVSSLESSRGGGVHQVGFMTFGLDLQKFLKIEWNLHWKLNWIIAENFKGIGMCLWCCWKDLDEQEFNGIYVVRFGFRMWEILILYLISAAENSNKFQKKPGFGRKSRLRTW